MKKVRKINTRCKFSEEFKKSRIKEFEDGSFTVKQISKMFSLSEPLIYKWIYKYSNYNTKKCIVVEEKDSSSQKLKNFEKRVAELERILGQKQIRIDYLEKMIDIAKEDYDIDIKKNWDTLQSNGLESIESK